MKTWSRFILLPALGFWVAIGLQPAKAQPTLVEAGARAQPGVVAPAPKFAGAALPVPPQQNARWFDP